MKYAGLFLCWACACFTATAQTEDPVYAEISHQRALLSLQREQVTIQQDTQARACWQKFAVNDCLASVRKNKRAQLDPIRQKELALNAQERAWRTRQRDERLQNKTPTSGGQSEQ